MKDYLRSRIEKRLMRMLPEHVRIALRSIDPEPASWDAAAVHLHALQDEVRQRGYPHYLYGLLSAARTARAVGASKFTAIEFGVAGGNGLLALEHHARAVEVATGVGVEVVGFDMGEGLPAREDPRDCPFAFSGGEFRMDEPALRARLDRATLRLGDVRETVQAFMQEAFAPIGFVANDLDLYTSTRDSLKLFTLDAERYLPRTTMYFDDLNGYPYTRATGEWAAISEFNAVSPERHIAAIHGLKFMLGGRYRFANWVEKLFLLHVFDHPRYNNPEETEMQSLALKRAPGHT